MKFATDSETTKRDLAAENGLLIAKQPNGLFCIYKMIQSKFTHMSITEAQLKEQLGETFIDDDVIDYVIGLAKDDYDNLYGRNGHGLVRWNIAMKAYHHEHGDEEAERVERIGIASYPEDVS